MDIKVHQEIASFYTEVLAAQPPLNELPRAEIERRLEFHLGQLAVHTDEELSHA